VSITDDRAAAPPGGPDSQGRGTASGRDQLVAMTREAIEHAKASTMPLVEGIHRVPAANYVDAERWRLELERIFRRLPLVLAYSCELVGPHAYKATEAAGTPVLVTRGADGEVRAFVNMCSHRGAQVVAEGMGTARRFSCPYHAWTYDSGGQLVGILDRDDFGDIDASCHGMTELPAEERCGLVFVGLTPGAELHLDAFLAGYDEVLEHLRFAECTLVGTQRVDGPNWKVAYDGYLDLYHIPILHRATFGPDFSNQAIYTVWGPHQRLVSPDQRLVELEALPEERWPNGALISGVWTIFPHVSIAPFDAGGRLYMVSQLFPGDTPATSYTIQSFLALDPPDDERRERIRKQMEFLLHVVRDEDYATGIRITRALATGAKAEVLFGRNEGGGQRFHRWTDALVATADAGLVDLYRRGI